MHRDFENVFAYNDSFLSTFKKLQMLQFFMKFIVTTPVNCKPPPVLSCVSLCVNVTQMLQKWFEFLEAGVKTIDELPNMGSRN